MEQITVEQLTGNPARANRVPDKAEYLKKIQELPREDQAFLEGYLFAKVTEKKGA